MSVTFPPLGPLTIICKAPGVEPVDAPGALVLDPEIALFHGRRVGRLHPETEHLLALVTHDPVRGYAPLPRPDYEQIIGFIDLTLKLMDLGVRTIQWRHPESGLHPRHQLGLADVAIALMRRGESQEG